MSCLRLVNDLTDDEKRVLRQVYRYQDRQRRRARIRREAMLHQKMSGVAICGMGIIAQIVMGDIGGAVFTIMIEVLGLYLLLTKRLYK